MRFPLTRGGNHGKIAPNADVVELVDSLDLGSNAQACRFESCHPHQNKTACFCRPFFRDQITEHSSEIGYTKATKKQQGGLEYVCCEY